jgi:hypothetical protein
MKWFRIRLREWSLWLSLSIGERSFHPILDSFHLHAPVLETRIIVRKLILAALVLVSSSAGILVNGIYEAYREYFSDAISLPFYLLWLSE